MPGRRLGSRRPKGLAPGLRAVPFMHASSPAGVPPHG